MAGEMKQDQLQLVSGCAIRKGLAWEILLGKAGASVGQGNTPKEG